VAVNDEEASSVGEAASQARWRADCDDRRQRGEPSWNLLEDILPERIKHLITVVINPGGTYKINFARVHEYAYFVCPANKEIITGIPIVQEELSLVAYDELGI